MNVQRVAQLTQVVTVLTICARLLRTVTELDCLSQHSADSIEGLADLAQRYADEADAELSAEVMS